MKLQESAQAVQNKLRELGYSNMVLELPASTRTAQEAADTIGCHVSQIAKSIIFRLQSSGKPLLVVASGSNRVNEQQVGQSLEEKLAKADANFVRQHTGFVIGGVPPLGHKEPILTFIDEDLFQYDLIWAAAGHPRAVFQLTPKELQEMTMGQVLTIK